MATGTTADFQLTRDELIEMAYQKIGIATTSTLTSRAAKALNLIIREEDAKGTRQAKNLWALSESHLLLTADGFIYTTTEGLESSILDLVSVYFRNVTGDDTQCDILDAQGYEALADKDATGAPTKVYLKRNVALASQTLYIDQAPASVGTTDVVTGTDALDYSCIKSHTAATDNKPITGQNWRLYWRQTGSGGSAWASGTEYSNGELLRYLFKRPLYDFDLSTDNPDMPQSWSRYLMWRLALDLSPEFNIAFEARQWIKGQAIEAYDSIFPSTTSGTTDYNNKVSFF